MLKEAIQYLRDTVHAEVRDVAGRPYATANLIPVKDPTPEPLKVNSLSALVGYLTTDFDGILADNEVLVRVVSPTEVRVESLLLSKFQQRHTYMIANPVLPTMVLGRYMDSQDFQIMLRSGFVGGPSRDEVVKFAGVVVDEMAKTSVDDGISQEVTIRSGVVSKSSERLPSPIKLAPFRTFLEVTQPESDFIFRMAKGPLFALFEADGGAWRLAALESLVTHLITELDNMQGVTVIA